MSPKNKRLPDPFQRHREYEGVNPPTNKDFLSIWAEPRKIPTGLTREGWAELDSTRIVDTCLMAAFAEQMPRRGGSEMSARQLARDTRTSRKLKTGYWTLWRDAYQRQEAPRNPDWDAITALAVKDERARRGGATVLWQGWFTERLDYLTNRRVLLATWAVREGFFQWGGSRFHILTREIETVERVKAVWDMQSRESTIKRAETRERKMFMLPPGSEEREEWQMRKIDRAAAKNERRAANRERHRLEQEARYAELKRKKDQESDSPGGDGD